ncbi:MAG: glycosyltransferase family 9 protein [Sulfuricellaceae bacterium]|jgi:heptosyltransferase-3
MNPRRILVIHVTRIGDTLLTTPVPRAFAKAWPEAEITFIGHPKRIEILRNLPFIHHIVPMTKRSAPFRGWLGRRRYDLALVFGYDLALVRYALRVARKVVAFRQEDASLNQKLFAIAGEGETRTNHAVPYLLQALEPLGVPVAGLHLSYCVTADENAWAQDTLRKRDIRGAPLIGLQVASFPTKSFRDWPLEHFVALCQRILEIYPTAHFLIFGGPLETQRTEALHQHFPSHSTLFAGQLTLRQTAALMNQVDLYVGVDTGPTHIMGALHRPMVALYHPTSPSRALMPLEHPCCFPVDHPEADRSATVDTPIAGITVDAVWQQVQAALTWNKESSTA